MTHKLPILTPRAPFAHLPVRATADCGVTVSDRDGLGLAAILARKGQEATLVHRMREHFCIQLPQGSHRRREGDLALAGIGPAAWLATHDRLGNALAAGLREAIGDLASITDQSDGYAVLRIEGTKVREVLERMFPVDISERVFKPGNVAVTLAGHIGATLWRLDNNVDGTAVFEVAVFRSAAPYFWRFLCESAAEFGFLMRRPVT